MKDKNFRKHITESGAEILAGKNDEQNEELLENNVNPKDTIVHTTSPGSPFCVIKGEADKEDVYEAALFCAKHSRVWKKSKVKKNITIHCFKGKDIYKEKGMKLGAFGVKKFKTITAKKEDIEKI